MKSTLIARLRLLLACPALILMILGCQFREPLFAEDKTASSKDSLDALANDFWQWRAQHQPFSQDDIPRIERRGTGPRDWSANSVARQKATLEKFEQRQGVADLVPL